MTLELGANRIKKIENLDGLVNLRHLWLGKNKISQIENLDALTNLRVCCSFLFLFSLSLSLFFLLIYLISYFLSLFLSPLQQVLSFQRNRLTKISEGLQHLKKLEELYLSG